MDPRVYATVTDDSPAGQDLCYAADFAAPGEEAVSVLLGLLLARIQNRTPSATQPGSLQSGEKALSLAVLEDAIRALLGQVKERGRRSRGLARDAEEWIASADRSWPFSFVNTCETLGIEPTCLRKALLSKRIEYRHHLRRGRSPRRTAQLLSKTVRNNRAR